VLWLGQLIPKVKNIIPYVGYGVEYMVIEKLLLEDLVGFIQN
jgi:hypothetical protein